MFANGIDFPVQTSRLSGAQTSRSQRSAIRAAKSGDFDGAEKMIEAGETDFLAGHKAHQQLLTNEASGTAAPVTLLLAHAEDQLMSAEAFKILAREFIDLYRRLDKEDA